MTIEEISDKIAKKRIEIEEIEDQIRSLQASWLKILPIHKGDMVKVVREDWNNKITEEIGMVTDIVMGLPDDAPIYDIYPLKKDGTVAKIGKIPMWFGAKIEKL